MANTPKYRSFASKVVISLGLIQATGDLVPPKDSEGKKAEELKSVCPYCTEAHLAKQFYKCSENEEHTGFTQKDCHKAKEDADGNLIKLTAAQVEAATSSDLEKGQMELRVHRREDVESKTIRTGSTYVFRPEAGSKLYGVLLDYLKSDPDIIVMGVINVRNMDKLFQLNVGMNGQLMFEELAWPEDVREFAAPSYEYDAKLLDMAKTLIEGSVTDFSQEDYKKNSRQRLLDLVAMVAAGQEVPVEKAKPNVKDSDGDFADALQAAIDDQLKTKAV